MKKLVDLMAAIAFSVAALLAFELPDILPGNSADELIPYLLMSVSFFYFIATYRLPTLKYFRLPELSIPSLAGIAVAISYAYVSMNSPRAISLPLISTIIGVIHLFGIGIGEELVSRGFVYGVLRKHGRVFALFFSSIFFGLMHLNVYRGDWDSYRAYWHCLGAAAFGLLAAVIMIVTKSILTPIVMHALYDWTVVFSKPRKSSGIYEPEHFDPLWQTIKDSFAHISIDFFFAFSLLGVLLISRFVRTPLWVKKIAVRFKLVA
jgi:membrane protease YdiL (CAAX protease family)